MRFIDKDYLIKEAENNLKDTIMNRIKNTSTGKMYKTSHYMMYTIGCDTTDAHLNGGFLLDDKYAEYFFRNTRTFFGQLGYSYSIWIMNRNDSNLETLLNKKGYNPTSEAGCAVMAIKKPIRNIELPEGYILKEVKNNNEIRDFAKVIKESFDKTNEEIQVMLGNKKVLINENTIAFIIYKGDKPVSAATTSLSKKIAGIYYVGTLKEERGKGLGSYIVKVSTNKGFEKRKEAVVLQASKLGENLYKKLGYETITRYKTFKIER